MFPRYLFIHLDDKTDNWAPIRSTLGVVSLVRFGHEPAKVPDTLLKLLAAREGSDGVHEVVTEEFRPGSKVRLTAGGFAGYEGIFKAKTGRERVVVLLDVLGREARTIVDLDSLEPV
jgi:transcriptional antiterminator RfaH